MSKEELNTCLKYFYTSARQQDGSYYKASSLKTIRAAIDRYLRSPPHCKQFSIVSDAAFTEANRVMLAFIKDLKKSGKIEDVVHRRAITKEQVEKLYDSGQLGPANSSDPAQLQRTVWFYIGLYFGRRGLENQRELKSGMLSLKTTPQRVEYFELNRQMAASQSLLADARDISDAKVMFSVAGSSRCPVTTIKNYLTHLDPSSEMLFQRQIVKFGPKEGIWYDPAPLGRNTLQHFMKEMCKRAGIEPYLTNNCLKKTAVSVFSDRNCAARHPVKVETTDSPDQAMKTHYLLPSFEPHHKSAAMSSFLSREKLQALDERINAPGGPKVVATIIDIEQQQDAAGGIVFQVRKIPIVVRQPNEMATDVL